MSDIEVLHKHYEHYLTYNIHQDQYVFIHDAILESLTYGDTQIPALGLSSAIKKLKEKDRVTILMFCVLKVHLYDKQAIVFAVGIFWVKSDSLRL